MSQLTKSVHYSQDDRITLVRREASNKVQRDVRPRMMRNREGLQETSRSQER